MARGSKTSPESTATATAARARDAGARDSHPLKSHGAGGKQDRINRADVVVLPFQENDRAQDHRNAQPNTP